MLGLPHQRSLIAYNGYTAGLGNRIRVVLGALSLAEAENRRFFYVWPTGEKFGPRLTDLWEFDTGSQVSRATSRLLAKRWHYVDEQVATWLDDDKRRELLWQIRTGSEIVLPPGARPWPERFRRLRPVPEIADRIRAEFDGRLRGRRYVGVMVRAHAVSHPKTLDSSPVEWFIRRMREIRAADPDVGFFLSCDTPAAQERILAEVPGCVALRDKGGYNTVAGVRSAVCDVYLLAGSAQLLGPHFSSFVELARHLAGHDLRLETPADQGAPPLDVRDGGLVTDPLRPYLRG